MKIGELAARAGLHASAVRYYEKVGLLVPAARVNGQRRYPGEALDRLLLIRLAGEMDFTLAEISLFLKGLGSNVPVGPRWEKLAHRKIIEIEQNIQRSLRLKSLLESCSIAAARPSTSASNALALAPTFVPSPNGTALCDDEDGFTRSRSTSAQKDKKAGRLTSGLFCLCSAPKLFCLSVT